MAGKVGSFSDLFLGSAALAVLLLIACGQQAEPTPSGSSVVEPVPSEPQTLVGQGDTAVPPRDASIRPGGAYGFSHFFFEELGGELVTTLVEGPLGEQVRSNLSYLQLKQLYDQGGEPPEELRMTREELGELVRQLDTVRESTEKYQDYEVALSDGFTASLDQVPNMGAHFVHRGRENDGLFDPSEPDFLLYIQDEIKKWKLVGTGFLQPGHLVGDDHPEAFAGPLDNWHTHYSLCAHTRGTFSATEEDCVTRGGLWHDTFGWMIHAYVWVDNPLGVFHMWNPNIPPVVPPERVRERQTYEPSLEGEVALTIDRFSLRDAQIKVGETLVWTNVDGVPHTITSGSQGQVEPGFDSGYVEPGQSFALTFQEPGEYSYTCLLHPFMNAKIVVTQ